jgi:hypothetical protein
VFHKIFPICTFAMSKMARKIMQQHNEANLARHDTLRQKLIAWPRAKPVMTPLEHLKLSRDDRTQS